MLTLKLSNKLPQIAAGTIVGLLMAFSFVFPAMAAEPVGPLTLPGDGMVLPVQGPRQVFRDDLTVEEGQVIEDDVFVYSGDVEIKEGGRITGDLIVFSGNVSLDQGAVVEGDLTNYSGNVDVEGHIAGDLAAMSGNVDLASSARVDGDISVVSGNIERSEGAVVGGNVVQGPSFRFPRGFVPDAPDVPRPGVGFGTESPSFFGRLVNFIGRLLAAALMTALAMLLVGGLFYARPQLIADARSQLNQQLALSAVVGVLANLTALFLAGLLAVTICLLPLALVPLLLLLAVNVIGWAVASQIVGERVVKISRQEVQPSLTILVGALFLTGTVVLLWALGGCFQFIASLLVFAVSSLGAGSVLVSWLNRRRGFGGSGSGSGGDVPPGGPVPPTAPSVYNSPVETDVSAPIDYVTAEEVNAMAGQSTAPAAKSGSQSKNVSTEGTVGSADSAQESIEHDVAAPIDHVTAEEVNTMQEQSPAAPKSRARGGKRAAAEGTTPASAPVEESVEQDVAAPIDYVTAQEVNTEESVTEGDDFLRLKGIGPTYARRLKDAGFATFAKLAAATPEEIAAAIGWPVDRVRRSEIIDQAKVLAK